MDEPTNTARISLPSRLFQPVDIAPLVFFRVVFGVLAFADVMGVWTYYHLYKNFFEPGRFHLKYPGFEWVPVLPEPFMSLFFVVLLAASVCIVLGRWYRVCTVVFAFGFTWLFFMESSLYLNHGYLFCWISWVMVFLPANRQWSGDVLADPSLQSDKIERWSLWILPFFMGVVYFFGGIAKINPDWLAGSPLDMWLRNVHEQPLFGIIWRHELCPLGMAWSGMLLDLTAPFLLLFRQTRKWVLGFILMFHLTNTLIFQIGIFPWLSISLSLLFFPDGEMRNWFVFLQSKIKKLHGLEAWWGRKVAAATAPAGSVFPKTIPPAYARTPVLFCLAAVAMFHLLMPLRHHLFAGDVAWTEEGHRFSWRMMLRSKQGYGTFEVKNLATGETSRVHLTDHLTDRQADKLMTHPDMILQFAHYLEDFWQKKGVEDVAVYADIRVKLNGRRAQPFIDPVRDLTLETWHFFQTSDWVMPLVLLPEE